MKIGITGISGFVGHRVAARAAGHEILGFSRRPHPPARRFSIEEPPDLAGIDAMIHLAGESILGRWTAEKKRRILESRVLGTRRVVEGMKRSGTRVLVCASGIGFYGDTGEREVDEGSPAGAGFLAEVCQAWEAEARRAEEFGARVVCLRTGMVLGKDGGAMRLIAPVFRLGLGGRLGNGSQWMSALHVDDLAGLYLHAAGDADWTGPVNAVMPEPFRNREFTRAVAAAVRRPAFLPAPALALRAALGETAHLILDSARVRPRRANGYDFRFPSLPEALKDILG